jgi:hypothetical protein
MIVLLSGPRFVMVSGVEMLYILKFYTSITDCNSGAKVMKCALINFRCH